MPPKAFLLQGLTEHTHHEALKTLLVQPDLDRVLISVAYVTRGGVDLIASELAEAECRVDAFAGIRNGATTREGLRALMNAGVRVHYVDVGATDFLFHPKIYVARCLTTAGVIIGSANLTVGGLNNNIESSIVLNLDLGTDEDLDLVESIFAEFDRLTSDYPQHVVHLEDEDELGVLHTHGRVVDEVSSPLPQGNRRTTEHSENIPRIPLKVQRLQSTVDPSQQKQMLGLPGTVPQSSVARGELLWKSKPLTERDLGIPSGSNTHPTGSVNLDKGLLEPSIDHRHYFRDEVFANLDWGSTSSPTVDEAHARFQLIVKGIDRGEFTLRIGHTTSTTTRSYLQRNAMTRLSWGPMRQFVASRDLIGRTMALYRDTADRTRFVVEID